MPKPCSKPDRAAIYIGLTASLLYSFFVLTMYLDGHAPTRPGALIPQTDPYLWQALFTLPWLFLTLLVFASLTHGLVARHATSRPFRQTLSSCALAFSSPLLLTFVIPETITYALAGHEALSTAIRFTGPITLLLWLVLTYRMLRRLHDLSWRRALWTAPAALIPALLFMSLVIR